LLTIFNKKFIIALEGLDGSGKTTQSLLLRDYLKKRGLKAKIIGRRFLLSTILTAFTKPDVVIADRYLYTIKIYLEYKQIKNFFVDYIFKILPEPNVIFFLELDIDSSLERIKIRGKNPDKYETREGLSIFKNGYEKEFLNSRNLYKINALKSTYDIHSKLCEFLIEQKIINT